MNISGKAAIVTGGASGLGEAVVRRLNDEGAYVTILDLNEEKAGDLVSELGDRVDFVKADVADEAQVKAAIDHAKGRSGEGLWAANSCAGIAIAMKTFSKRGPHQLDLFELVIRVNLVGTFNVMRLAAEAMAEHEPNEEGERGVVVNTASVAAFEGQIGQIAYAASKGGVVSMAIPAARDLCDYGIRVNTIAPGLFDTPLFRLLPEEKRAELGNSIPFPRRLGKPSEYALLVSQMIANPMLNGEVVRLDGALRMAPK